MASIDCECWCCRAAVDMMNRADSDVGQLHGVDMFAHKLYNTPWSQLSREHKFIVTRTILNEREEVASVYLLNEFLKLISEDTKLLATLSTAHKMSTPIAMTLTVSVEGAENQHFNYKTIENSKVDSTFRPMKHTTPDGNPRWN